jgi:predicted DNA-binding ribbon-helix-helix protein
VSDERLGGVVETPAASFGIDEERAPEFRVVLAASKRRGVRLERLYWRLLGDIAERRNEKRPRLIASILESAAGESDNSASVLRCFVARTLEEERGELARRTTEGFAINLLQQAPIPAFAINRQKKLHQVNQEFIQLLRITAGDMSQKTPHEVVEMTLDTPIEELFALSAEGSSTHCNYHIQLDGRQRRGRAKLVAVPPAPSATLVGYIVT